MIELINKMSNECHINKEDILFILFSKYGVNVDLPYSRIRFLFSHKNDDFFHRSDELQISQFFLHYLLTRRVLLLSIKKERPCL